MVSQVCLSRGRIPAPTQTTNRGSQSQPKHVSRGCFPLLFNHPSFRKPAVFPGFWRCSRKKDPWKEWGRNRGIPFYVSDQPKKAPRKAASAFSLLCGLDGTLQLRGRSLCFDRETSSSLLGDGRRGIDPKSKPHKNGSKEVICSFPETAPFTQRSLARTSERKERGLSHTVYFESPSWFATRHDQKGLHSPAHLAKSSPVDSARAETNLGVAQNERARANRRF